MMIRNALGSILFVAYSLSVYGDVEPSPTGNPEGQQDAGKFDIHGPIFGIASQEDGGSSFSIIHERKPILHHEWKFLEEEDTGGWGDKTPKPFRFTWYCSSSHYFKFEGKADGETIILFRTDFMPGQEQPATLEAAKHYKTGRDDFPYTKSEAYSKGSLDIRG